MEARVPHHFSDQTADNRSSAPYVWELPKSHWLSRLFRQNAPPICDADNNLFDIDSLGEFGTFFITPDGFPSGLSPSADSQLLADSDEVRAPVPAVRMNIQLPGTNQVVDAWVCFSEPIGIFDTVQTGVVWQILGSSPIESPLPTTTPSLPPPEQFVVISPPPSLTPFPATQSVAEPQPANDRKPPSKVEILFLYIPGCLLVVGTIGLIGFHVSRLGRHDEVEEE